MGILAIVGFILAVINPVIGGVLVGYLVWLNQPDIGFQIIILSFFMLSLYAIGFIVWATKKIQRLEKYI
ncbi:MAG: hypothetical protein ACLFVK_05905 [Dehalococcoidia bacterium]